HWRRGAGVGKVVDHDAPRALVVDGVVHDGVVLTAGYLDARSHRTGPGDAEGGHVGVVVVMDVVAGDHGAGRGRSRGTGAVLGRGGVVVVEGVGDDAGPVAVPLRVLDPEVPPGVGAREAQSAVLGVHVVEDGVAVGTCAHVVRAVAHVAGVRVGQGPRPLGVADEEPVLGHGRRRVLKIGRRGGQVAPRPGTHADQAASVPAVPPDLVAPVTVDAAEEVAHRQVLDRHTVGLRDLDAVATGRAQALVLWRGAARRRSAGQR